jgi:hypothetical protein
MRLVFVLAAFCLISAACAYKSEDSDSYDLAPVSGAVEESLLDLDAANKARRESYQSNVGTVYTHLNEIIRKILVHKKAWSVKYEEDLTRVAKELADHLLKERDARKAKDAADNKEVVAAAEAKRKNNAWIKAHADLNQKKKDADKERHDLKVMFDKGNGMKAGDIAMIVRIRCMVSDFNKDSKYKCDKDGKALDHIIKAPASKAPASKKADGGVFGKAAAVDKICILVNPKIVDMSPREEGPNMIDDINKYVTNGAKRLFQFTDIVATLSSGKCDGATLVLPEFQNRDINNDEGRAIRSFVQGGGSAILADDALNRIMSAIKIVDPSLKWAAAGTGTATKNTASARFAKCPKSLPALNGGNSIRAATLGAGAQSLYTADGGKVMVAQVKSGAGQLWFLGFDWYAKSGREGWAQVLAAIIG